MLAERQKQILYALIDEYVARAVPVGSQTIAVRAHLNCSAATVRNELAALESEGYLEQPHTSSGRIPTDAGYRELVDDKVTDKRINRSWRQPKGTNEHYRDIETHVEHAATRLAAWTNCLALSKIPDINSATVKRIDMLSLTPSKLLFVLITDRDQVVNRTIELRRSVTPEEVASVTRSLNAACANKQAGEVALLKQGLEQAVPGENEEFSLMAFVVDEIINALDHQDAQTLRYQGVAALLSQPEFHQVSQVRPIVDAIEAGLDVMDVVSSQATDGRVIVSIGAENGREAFRHCSVIVSPYFVGKTKGYIGVIGPTRLNYPHTVSAVFTTAQQLSENI